MKLGPQKDSSPGSTTTMPLLRGLPTTGEDGVASMRSLHLAATYYGTLPGQSMKMMLLCVNHISLEVTYSCEWQCPSIIQCIHQSIDS